MTNRPYVDATDAEDLDVSTTGSQFRSMTNRVAAVFDNRDDAERAIDWFRSRGVPNDNISVMARDPNYKAGTAERPGAERVDVDPGSDAARGAGTGLAAGAAVGAL